MVLKDAELFVFVPGLPLESTPNGVCTYARHLLHVLTENPAIRVHLVAKSRAAGWKPSECEHGYYPPTRSLYNRVLMRALGRAGYETFMARRFGAFLAAKSNRQQCIIEMEEAFGQSLLVQRYTKTPVIVRLHGPWFLVGASQGVAQDAVFLDRIQREGEAIFAADAVTAPSAYVLDAVEKHYGRTLKNKAVVPNPFPYCPIENQWAPENDGTVVFIGRFDRVKGADVFIEAMFMLAARRPGLRAVFAGPEEGQVSGVDGIAVNRAQFVALCEQRYGVGSPIAFVGRKTPDEIVALRRSAAVCVIASRVEMFSYTVAESLAQGVPTVASRVGGIPEMLQDGDNGLLFESENASELALCVERILQTPSLAHALSRNALRTVSEKFSKERMAKAYAVTYKNVLAATSAEATGKRR